MLKFCLTTPESYIIFKGLQKILNSENIDNNETIQVIDKNGFSKSDFIDITKRDFSFNNINSKIKIVEDFSMNGNFYFIKFNVELFNHLSTKDIFFIKNISFDYKYVATLKMLQLDTSIFDLDMLSYIDNNTTLLIEKLEEERLNDKKQHKLKHIDNYIKTLSNKTMEDYVELFKIIKSDLNNKFLFKVKNDNEIKIKFIKDLLSECNKQFIACKKIKKDKFNYKGIISEDILKLIKNKIKEKEINYYKYKKNECL